MHSSPIEAGLAGVTAAESVLGTRDPFAIAAEAARACERLGLGVPVECFRFEVSVGALFGLRLRGGGRVALKVHRPPLGPGKLQGIQRAQRALADDGFPAPRPLGVAPYRDRWASVEQWLDAGRRPDPARPEVRAALAETLARLVRFAPDVRLPGAVPRRRLWPRPHSAIFDFRRRRGDADWIDAVARRARTELGAGEVVTGHADWSVKHFRFRGGHPSAVYDWDSLCREREPVVAGFAARTHDAVLDRRTVWRPSASATFAFLDDYERARGRAFSAAERRAALAAAVYVTAYTARCEHALDPDRSRRLATDARSTLAAFAGVLDRPA